MKWKIKRKFPCERHRTCSTNMFSVVDVVVVAWKISVNDCGRTFYFSGMSET